ncbi:MAG: hypothetical protein JSR37_00435 [Verrucomicrobia bacterium]|nr:hypothetical protein [Verrucomicrobiota bacterium]
MTSDLNKQIDSFLEEQRAEYRSELEPFEVYAAKFREKLQNFTKTFFHGRELVGAEERPLPPFETLVATYLEKGSLYKLLGYSLDDLKHFYSKAYTYLDKKEYQLAYDAHFFLLAIAPHIPEAWLNFGYTCCQLGEPLLGIEGFGNAIERAPSNPAGYLAAAGAYSRLHDKDSAALVCDVGIEYAETHNDSKLKMTLEEAKRQVVHAG